MRRAIIWDMTFGRIKVKNQVIEQNGIRGTVDNYVVNGKEFPRLCNITVDYGGNAPLHTACDRYFAEQHLDRLFGVANTILNSTGTSRAA